jgi:hypothetical protein
MTTPSIQAGRDKPPNAFLYSWIIRFIGDVLPLFRLRGDKDKK